MPRPYNRYRIRIPAVLMVDVRATNQKDAKEQATRIANELSKWDEVAVVEDLEGFGVVIEDKTIDGKFYVNSGSRGIVIEDVERDVNAP